MPINFFDNQGFPRDPANVKKEMDALTPTSPFDANFYDSKTGEFYFPNRFKIKNSKQREMILDSHGYNKAGFNKLVPKRYLDADTKKKYFRQESDGEYYYPMGVSSLGSKNNPITLPGVTVYGKSLPEVTVEAPDLWYLRHLRSLNYTPIENIPWEPHFTEEEMARIRAKAHDRMAQHLIKNYLAPQAKEVEAKAEKEMNDELNRRINP